TRGTSRGDSRRVRRCEGRTHDRCGFLGDGAPFAVVTVRVSARARREADRRDAWWRANRLEAPDLFVRELRFESPVRRILLPETETHIYHARIGDDVAVLAIWGARRGRGPRL